MDSTHMTKRDAALMYHEAGMQVIPIDCDNKVPLVKWKQYQTQEQEYEEVDYWWTEWPNADVGIITGELSGIVAVDCDNEAAIQAVADAGIHSTVQSNTKRGKHLIFSHPDHRVKNQANWRGMDKVDVRGDGGYIKVWPSDGYSWDLVPGTDVNDIAFEAPTWGFGETGKTGEFNEDLDLSDVKDDIPETQGKGGRNDFLARVVGQLIRNDPKLWGKNLLIEAWAENLKRCQPPMDQEEVRTIVKSVAERHMERYPEEFNENKERVAGLVTEETERLSKLYRTVFESDAACMFGEVEDREWLVENLIPASLPGLVASSGGVGKTYLLLDLAIKVAYFNPSDNPTFMGHPIRKFGKVVMFLAEDDREEVQRRLMTIDPLGTRGLQDEQLMVVSLLDLEESLQFGEKNYDVPVLTQQASDVQKVLSQIDDLALVVFDPLQSFFDWRFDEDNLAADKALKFAHRIATSTGASVVFTHHLRKDDFGMAPTTPQGAIAKVRGASNIVNSSRFAIPIWRPNEDVSLAISEQLGGLPNNAVFMAGLGKENFGGDVSTHWMIRDERTGLLVDRTAELDTETTARREHRTVEDVVFEYVRDSADPVTPKHIIRDLTLSKSSMDRALMLLVKDGRIVRVGRGKYEYAGHHPKFAEVVEALRGVFDDPKSLGRHKKYGDAVEQEGAVPLGLINERMRSSTRELLWREGLRELEREGFVSVVTLKHGKTKRPYKAVKLAANLQT